MCFLDLARFRSHSNCCFFADKSKTHIDVTNVRFGQISKPNQFLFLNAHHKQEQNAHRRQPMCVLGQISKPDQFLFLKADKSKTHTDVTNVRFGQISKPNQLLFLCKREQDAHRRHRCAFGFGQIKSQTKSKTHIDVTDVRFGFGQVSTPNQFLFLCRQGQNAHRCHRCAFWIGQISKPNQLLFLNANKSKTHIATPYAHFGARFQNQTNCRFFADIAKRT